MTHHSNILTTLLMFIVIAISTISCSDDTNIIYYCGNEYWSPAYYHAFYGFNDQIIDLNGNYARSYVNSMTVNNGNVYCCGYIEPKRGDNLIAVYWKNGKEIRLTDGSFYASANDITISNGDIFCVGSEADGYVQHAAIGYTYDTYEVRRSQAKCWKNGVEYYTLSNGDYNASANGISITPDGTIHIIGYDKQKTGALGTSGYNYQYISARHWVNGHIEELDGAGCSNATAIYADNEQIYIGGWYDRSSDPGYISEIVAYWDGDFKRSLPLGGFIEAIHLVGSDIYMVGFDKRNDKRNNEESYAVYWKNFEYIPLYKEYSNEQSAIYDMTSVGEDVYMAGFIGDKAGWWKNDHFIALNNVRGNLTGIHVEKSKIQ